MAYGAGIGASLGIATESVAVGTYAAPDHFTEFNSESLNYVKNVAVGMGLRAGGVLPRTARRVVTTTGGAGDVTFDLPTNGLGIWLAHALGSFPSKAAGAFTFTLGDLAGKSFTTQVGMPRFDGTVDPKTLTGCKITDWEIAVPNAGIATFKATIDSSGFTRSTALATPSYSAATSVYHFAQATLSIGGSTVANVSDVTISGSNTLKTDRYTIGNSGAKREQIANGFRTLSGSLNAEFVDTTAYAAILADTSSSLALTLTSGSQSLSITLPSIKFDGDVPQVGGPEAIVYPLNFQAYDNGTDQPITVVYTTSDSAL